MTRISLSPSSRQQRTICSKEGGDLFHAAYSKASLTEPVRTGGLLLVAWLLNSSLVLRADSSEHWAFQPLRDVAPPAVARQDLVRSPIDTFVIAALEERGLQLSPPADRRTLIRRLTFDLTGLPPTDTEVRRFVEDDRPQAWEQLVDRLLASPHYGEKQARLWLDLARYSDSKGYVYAREERFWVHAWAYRDWVVRAFNADMPYDRFLLLQIAADQVEGAREDLAAMGFLTLGRRFLGVQHDIIDDRIDVVTRGTMALTVSCARCHDHKYDPVPTRDYYSLYGIFENSVERLVATADIADESTEFARGLRERQAKLDKTMVERRAQAAGRVRGRIADYLVAQLELEKYPEEGFDQILQPTDIFPAFVRRWRDWLARAEQRDDTVFRAWRLFSALSAERFSQEAEELCRQLQRAPKDEVHPAIAAAFVEPPADLREVAARYGRLLGEVDRRRAADEDESEMDAALLAVLQGPESPCEVPDEPIVRSERYFPTSDCEALWKLQGEVDRWLLGSTESPPQALILADRSQPVEARVLRRGDPARRGRAVPRQFLGALTQGERTPFEHGSGRLELARAIVDEQNPLTARVAVNRIWMQHFGEGLVRTPSDFGRRASPPSHPELLDWLAARFIEDGYSVAKVHRPILLSATYRQSGRGPQTSRARETDPENRLLWHMPPRRLSFEELRDAALAVSGELDRTLGGRAVDLFESKRRALYASVDRQFFPSVLRIFDVANPDLHVPKRSETTVPQQALFLLNHPFLLDRARALAELCERSGETVADRVHALFRAALQRDPTPAQSDRALRLLEEGHREPESQRVGAEQWSYGFGEYDKATQRVRGFEALPWFDGRAWQGGRDWPDSDLGWVQLTATGGHAGNHKGHAAVRRWTAPAALELDIRSRLSHRAEPGDGIRGFLVSSRRGLLHSAVLHASSADFDLDRVEVAPGETLDFVVDLRDNLHSDEFEWAVTLRDLAGESAWDAREDFAGTLSAQMSPLEQLAQVLLLSNEFLFID